MQALSIERPYIAPANGSVAALPELRRATSVFLARRFLVSGIRVGVLTGPDTTRQKKQAEGQTDEEDAGNDEEWRHLDEQEHETRQGEARYRC